MDNTLTPAAKAALVLEFAVLCGRPDDAWRVTGFEKYEPELTAFARQIYAATLALVTPQATLAAVVVRIECDDGRWRWEREDGQGVGQGYPSLDAAEVGAWRVNRSGVVFLSIEEWRGGPDKARTCFVIRNADGEPIISANHYTRQRTADLWPDGSERQPQTLHNVSAADVESALRKAAGLPERAQ